MSAAAAGGERWSLAGATALVTGGSKGIGHAIVEELAGFGARVHTCARSAADLEECRRRWAEMGLSVTVSVCDVAVRAGREKLMDTVKATFDGKLDILVNNAALLILKPPAEYTAEDYSQIMATNLESCFHLCQLAYPLLIKASVAGGGSVVHISSIASFLAFPQEALYSVTKALVTGGSKGIGHAIVEELAGFGARVHTCARSAADLEECRRRWAEMGLSVTVSVCDVAVRAGREKLMDTVKATFDGKLDILVNNAALLILKPPAEYTAEDYSQIMATNLESCFHLCQLAYPLLIKASVAGGGSVVHISSIASFLAFPQEALYSVTKGGLNQLTRSLAVEWARDKIRVNCVAPGVIMTDMAKELPAAVVQQELSRIPMRRTGEPAEVASLVSFLCLAAAFYVTGQVICIDGGRTISA